MSDAFIYVTNWLSIKYWLKILQKLSTLIGNSIRRYLHVQTYAAQLLLVTKDTLSHYSKCNQPTRHQYTLYWYSTGTTLPASHYRYTGGTLPVHYR